jgi:hypothetical protein
LILREAGVEVNGGSAIVSRARGRGWWQCDSVNCLRNRMVAACSESRVEAAARFEARVEAVARSEAEDEAAACSEPEIKDGRRRRHDGV